MPGPTPSVPQGGGGGGQQPAQTPAPQAKKKEVNPAVMPTLDDFEKLVAGKDNKWSKDLKSADTKKPDESATKGNEIINNFDYQTHSGIKYDEHVENKADLLRVDIDLTNNNNRIYTLGQALAPLYNVALTKATIKLILLEGFSVREANLNKKYYLDDQGEVKKES